MGISPWSRDVVLAVRRGLFIIDLEAPFKVPCFLPQGGTWDVADVQWNSITDINWHTTERDTIPEYGPGTCVNLRKSIFGLGAFSSPGTLINWNCQNSHILASSHADKVLIWDRRKGSLPTKPTEIVTCSLDKTIKVWDSKTMTLRTRIKTGCPVWRAHGLPFGRGVLSLAQRGETALEMFSREPRIRPCFQGHSDVVKEFVWRKGANDTVFQLITWSKERTLDSGPWTPI
ncbi:uncharacterized protein C8R40DRAFT_1162031 [Lentinula edodes]|uniref:uncharacterized protein n=1 Tax=Lentinula edodes TaxID=5353 RepID=UPI001E8CBB09|nr:uncharacterized protein C8R40DRAFT_1162031 [Lentinula edodes]KAH7872857.1 hypothetical protein C8R40DRAFT_1162031 [Lentinula edodes]